MAGRNRRRSGDPRVRAAERRRLAAEPVDVVPANGSRGTLPRFEPARYVPRPPAGWTLDELTSASLAYGAEHDLAPSAARVALRAMLRALDAHAGTKGTSRSLVRAELAERMAGEVGRPLNRAARRALAR